jgi:hypothetical protein
MITPEKLKQIYEGEPATQEDIKELIQTILELDTNMVIMQNALQLSMDNSQEIFPAMGEKILSLSGRTDSKTKKKVAKYSAEVAARFNVSIQLYLAGAAEKAKEILDNPSQFLDTATQEVENENK